MVLESVLVSFFYKCLTRFPSTTKFSVMTCMGKALVLANTLFQQHTSRLYTWTSPDGRHRNQIDYIFAAKDGEALYSQQKQDQELTVAQIMNCLLPNSDWNWRKWKNHYTIQVWPKSNPLWLYEWKWEIDLGTRSGRVPDELWMEVCDIVQETGIKTIPKKKKCKKAKWLSEEVLQRAVAKTSKTMLNSNGESGHPCLVPDFRVFCLCSLLGVLWFQILDLDRIYFKFVFLYGVWKCSNLILLFVLFYFF